MITSLLPPSNESSTMTIFRAVSGIAAAVVVGYWTGDQYAHHVFSNEFSLPISVCYLFSGLFTGAAAGVLFPRVAILCIILFPLYHKWKMTE